MPYCILWSTISSRSSSTIERANGKEYAEYAYNASEAVDDKVLLLMTVLVRLRQADPGFTSTVPQQELNGEAVSDLWSDRLSYLLAGLKARFSEYSDNSIIWDYGLPYPETDVNSYDTSHANRMPALFDALYDAGDTTFSLSDYQKLANLLTGTIWTLIPTGLAIQTTRCFPITSMATTRCIRTICRGQTAMYLPVGSSSDGSML